jgi:hypothetical protein
MSKKTSRKPLGSDKDIVIHLDRSFESPIYTLEGLKKFIASQGNKPKA